VIKGKARSTPVPKAKTPQSKQKIGFTRTRLSDIAQYGAANFDEQKSLAQLLLAHLAIDDERSLAAKPGSEMEDGKVSEERVRALLADSVKNVEDYKRMGLDQRLQETYQWHADLALIMRELLAYRAEVEGDNGLRAARSAYQAIARSRGKRLDELFSTEEYKWTSQLHFFLKRYGVPRSDAEYLKMAPKFQCGSEVNWRWTDSRICHPHEYCGYILRVVDPGEHVLDVFQTLHAVYRAEIKGVAEYVYPTQSYIVRTTDEHGSERLMWLPEGELLAPKKSACSYASRYKGKHYPFCNDGIKSPCDTCLETYSRASLRSWIIHDPEIHGGAPVFQGTNIPVKPVVEALSKGEILPDLQKTYPDIAESHIEIARIYAKYGETTPQ
jgi:uncharacterized protein (DUF433 family)